MAKLKCLNIGKQKLGILLEAEQRVIHSNLLPPNTKSKRVELEFKFHSIPFHSRRDQSCDFCSSGGIRFTGQWRGQWRGHAGLHFSFWSYNIQCMSFSTFLLYIYKTNLGSHYWRCLPPAYSHLINQRPSVQILFFSPLKFPHYIN